MLTPQERRAFTSILDTLRPDEVWHGGVRGVDSECGQIAAELGYRVRVVRAPWDLLRPVGDLLMGKNDAGPLRNWWMARTCRRAGGGAWVFFRGNAGTDDMVQQCRAHLIHVIDLRLSRTTPFSSEGQ